MIKRIRDRARYLMYAHGFSIEDAVYKAICECGEVQEMYSLFDIDINDLLGRYALKQADIKSEDKIKLDKIKEIVKELITVLE